MTAPGEIKAYYDEFVAHLLRDKFYDNPRHRKIFRLLDDIQRAHGITSALEIGCGIGIIAEHIRRRCPDVVGLDISESNIAVAAATVRGVRFQAGDFLGIDLGRHFDLITLFDVLEHVPKHAHAAVFDKLKQYSHPRSLLALTIPDPDYLDYCRAHHPERLQIVDESIGFEDVCAQARRVGWQLLAYERFGIDYRDQYRYFLFGAPRPFTPETVPASGNALTRFVHRRWRRLKGAWRKLRFARAMRAVCARGMTAHRG